MLYCPLVRGSNLLNQCYICKGPLDVYYLEFASGRCCSDCYEDVLRANLAKKAAKKHQHDKRVSVAPEFAPDSVKKTETAKKTAPQGAVTFCSKGTKGHKGSLRQNPGSIFRDNFHGDSSLGFPDGS